MTSEQFQKEHGKKKSLRKKSAQQINAEMTASFLKQCMEAGLPKPLCEFKFHPDREWRIDFCFATPDETLAVEIEGGIWNHGAHTRGKHFLSDMEKYNELTFMGIKLLRFTVRQVNDGTAIREIKRIL